MAAGCGANRGGGALAGAPARGGEPLDVDGLRIVDLTHPFNAKTLYWPTSPRSFELERLAFGATPGGYFYAANAFCTPEHGGTHLDAPIHFHEGGRSADQIPLSS